MKSHNQKSKPHFYLLRSWVRGTIIERFSRKTTADPDFCQVSFCLIQLLAERGVTIPIAPILQFTIVMIYHFSVLMMWINGQIKIHKLSDSKSNSANENQTF